MLTSNKKLVIILFSFILLFNLFHNKSYAVVQQTPEFYVNDYANIISDETEQYIININKDLYNKTGAQIVVVSVSSLDGYSIEDYALEVFRSYGIGDKVKNNGVLFLVSVEDRETRIEVGSGLEGRITDGKAGRILDNYVIPYFKDNNWNSGIENGFNAILEEVTSEYDISLDGTTSAVDLNYESEHYENVQYLTAFIVFIVCLICRHIFSGLTKWLCALRNWNYGYNYRYCYSKRFWCISFYRI